MSWISKNRQDSKILGAIQAAFASKLAPTGKRDHCGSELAREDVRPGNANQ
ncbi:hypothetical protein AN403_3407 [Pseudomonas fluorescens]|uniref:Uncharacterized protein n=1 Tax=Pseudomonas fluorescens TaxID=294 RepID=A0A0P8XGV1_PSEFL|nr:hypothetical protein AN403_3407 [Pseudomonas fluorescens]